MCQGTMDMALGNRVQVSLKKKDITRQICECHAGMRSQTMKDKQRRVSTCWKNK